MEVEVIDGRYLSSCKASEIKLHNEMTLTHSFLQWLKYFWMQILQELLRGEQQRTIGV